jgi:hypothetical protein
MFASACGLGGTPTGPSSNYVCRKVRIVPIDGVMTVERSSSAEDLALLWL